MYLFHVLCVFLSVTSVLTSSDTKKENANNSSSALTQKIDDGQTPISSEFPLHKSDSLEKKKLKSNVSVAISYSHAVNINKNELNLTFPRCFII